MKKVLILSSLLLSLGALAENPVPAPEVEVPEVEQNFVIKGLTAMHAKCAKAKAKFDTAEEAKATWEAVKQDCQSLPQIPAAELPKTDL